VAENEPHPFEAFFLRVTGRKPYRYQVRLATVRHVPEVLDVPTGLGKTAAIILSWLWNRNAATPAVNLPRRLIYCLPMRTLVAQTARVAKGWIEKSASAGVLRSDCRVHVLMGGEQTEDWDLQPEADAVLIGTQDMLLSRLLNRGYGMSRYRWPMQFGLLGNDCLWVMDEVQLMGTGLATTVQVDLFQKKYWRPLLPCHFIWMSATLGTSLLRTRDREDHECHQLDPNRVFRLDWVDGENSDLGEKAEEGVRHRLAAQKRVAIRKDEPPVRGSTRKPGILDPHIAGRMSLVIFNTVPEAQNLFRQVGDAIAKASVQPELVLLHGRFRPADRRVQMDRLLCFVAKQDASQDGAVSNHPGIVVVSTQVVEAGIDISSVKLWSQIAPWASVIQRLGRLNREGKQLDAAAEFWMPKGQEENTAGAPNESKKKQERIGPYFKKDLDTAKKLLEEVKKGLESGQTYREALDKVLASEASRQALEVEYEAVIRPHDFLELFATEPDLSGGFTDISRFVRNQDRNVDTYVYWRPTRRPAEGETLPSPDELCPVPFYSLEQFLRRTKGTASEWDGESGNWTVRRVGPKSSDIRPGMTLRLWTSQGGYWEDLGWTGEPADKPTPIAAVDGGRPDDISADGTSGATTWLSLTDHTEDVVVEAGQIARDLGMTDSPEGQTLSVVARWHDVGKSSAHWDVAINRYLDTLRQKLQGCLQEEASGEVNALLRAFETTLALPSQQSWAKFPDVRSLLQQLPADRRDEYRRKLFVRFLPGYRHEAASAMVAWDRWQREGPSSSGLTALGVYLIACHHGKVRTVLRANPLRKRKGGGFIQPKIPDLMFGIRSGDELLPVPGILPDRVVVPTGPRHFGMRGTWDDTAGTFCPSGTSWVELVSDLLGTLPSHQQSPESGDAAREAGGPTRLGPFKLAFLEALICAADRRASRNPGKGRRQ
jgi:CRISPR-associated endonuclease/helicase Cas3